MSAAQALGGPWSAGSTEHSPVQKSPRRCGCGWRRGLGARGCGWIALAVGLPALAACGVEFEKNNPVTSLMTDPSKGLIREDILNERILSAIVEIKSRLAQVPMVLKKIRELSREVDTVISVGVSTRCDAAGDDALRAILEYEGYPMYRGKTNLGLGRITTVRSEDGL